MGTMKTMEMNKPDFKIEENKIIFSIDLDLYSLDTIYGASYYLVDQMYIYLTKGSSKNKIQVYLKAKEEASKSKLEEMAGKFLNELINVGFRYKISKKNNKISERVANAALTGAYFGGNNRPKEGKKNRNFERGSRSWMDDPEGIAVPWEKRNNKSNKSNSDKLYKENEDGMVIPEENKN